jgi:hypothetical protein
MVMARVQLVWQHGHWGDAVTITLATALLLQAAAVALLRHRLGRTWLHRPVALLVLASVAYDGVSPLLTALPSIGRWDTYRQGVERSYADQAVLILALGMLAFTFCYLLTRPERVGAAAKAAEIRQAAQILDWRLLTIACTPLALLTYEGRGYNNGTLTTGAGAPLTSSLAAAFFVLLVALASFSFLLRHGRRLFLPVVAAQSLLLAAAGERTPVLVDAIALVVLLAWSGMRPSARQLGGAAALTVVGVLAITGVRAEQGRALYYQDSGLGSRLTALAEGITSVGSSTSAAGGPGLVPQAVLRLDATDFGAAILQAENMGAPRLDAVGVPESLLIAVPSFLWPSKLGHALEPVGEEITNFGLQRVNFLPGLAGMYLGYLSPAWVITLLGLLGLLAGRAEAILLRLTSPTRLVMLAGSVIAALDYERGIQGILLDLRTVAVLAGAVKLTELALARRHASKSEGLAPTPKWTMRDGIPY